MPEPMTLRREDEIRISVTDGDWQDFAAEPPLITTAEELRALPVGTVLLDSNSDAWQTSGNGDGRYAHHASGGTFNLGSGWQVEAILTNAPFRVLHTPAAC
jgi:hypothetical protein